MLHTLLQLLALCPGAAPASAPHVTPSAASAASAPWVCGDDEPVRSPEAEVADLLARGRSMLELGRPADAEQLFLQAHTLGDGGLSTQLWILRAWMEQGRINDALDEIDRLAWSGSEGTELSYLYGMACHRRAMDHLRSGIPERTTGVSFQDAVEFLSQVTASGDARFEDAWVALAESAWYTQDLGLAARAGERAVELRPASAQAHYVLGRVHFSEYVVSAADAALEAAATAQLAAAAESFEHAARLALEAPPSDPSSSPPFRAEVRRQLGYARVYEKNLDLASTAFSVALSLEPSGLEFPRLLDWLSTPDAHTRFIKTLERANADWTEREGATEPGNALLLWWLGWARLQDGLFEPAERAFQEALDKQPTYVDAHFYIALARYQRKDFGAAVDALATLFDLDPPNLVARVEEDLRSRAPILDWLAGYCHREERWADAARLGQVLAVVEDHDWERWNNLGLFARFAGRELAESQDEEQRAEATKYFEIALGAYASARERAPHMAHLYNDAAVVLHYHLERDSEQARAWYNRAIELSRELIERGDAPEAELALARKALEDARKNLDALDDRR